MHAPALSWEEFPLGDYLHQEQHICEKDVLNGSIVSWNHPLSSWQDRLTLQRVLGPARCYQWTL